MNFLWLFLSLLSLADAPQHWSHLLEVTDRHEFYNNREPILKPAEAWQTLFAVTYFDADLVKLKDCVMLKVPGSTTGILKIKKIAANGSCDDYFFRQGDLEISDIKSIQFYTDSSEAGLEILSQDYKETKWKASAVGNRGKSEAGMSVSSAEFKGPKVILLAPKSDLPAKPLSFLKDKSLCHDINDDCVEVSPSQCSRCERGWHEIPNGCKAGPKYCGLLSCGGKDGPACRRGIVWQKTEKEMDCLTNSTFAYCQKGLQITCEGRKAYCR